jgi:uncharacterized DUF497 family protein
LSYSFEWDEKKNLENIRKHGISFETAQDAFLDMQRIIAKDTEHSTVKESRYYCFARTGDGVITVRFTYRDEKIRIFGAGYWRKGKQFYEKENNIH